MKLQPLNIVILGLSITSSWGNGHATTFRGLVRELHNRGHNVLFLERDVEWYASNRDLPNPPFGRTELYGSLSELKERWKDAVRTADFVMVGSYVPQGAEVGRWVQSVAEGATGFYDIDTPVTLANLAKGPLDYLSAELIPGYGVYLSFTGGPILQHIEQALGSPMARPLYCSVDPELYFPEQIPMQWDLGYMGTYSDDRQPTLEKLLIEPARRWPQGRFVVAGPQYPSHIPWSANVERIEHLPPGRHRHFYNSQKFTLNVTRADMIQAGYSPSVRLFEAAACATPIISDWWNGLDTLFRPGEEIFIAQSPEETEQILKNSSDAQRRQMGEKARARVLKEHTAQHRAMELEQYILELLGTDRKNQHSQFSHKQGLTVSSNSAGGVLSL
ncbi:MAG: CgeB family protein [Verrucomicrobiales bacterium]